MHTEEIGLWALSSYYALLIIPLGLMIWLRIPIIGKTLSAVARMTLQLLFVGFYLQIVFSLNSPWINGLWLVVMVAVADFSIVRGCGLSMDAQYVIPIGGMILGNCLRADIIGIRSFYEAMNQREKAFLYTLSQGARLHEAIRPYLRHACRAALLPTVATMATIGLVALPGMMTGVILGGADPMTAIKYQISIMIAIFTGTSITVVLAILMSVRGSFGPYGILDPLAFRS
ncbi:MAG: ABC transporter permease [Deltaproteobacteria bacterium]|nr:ABC transporter permease [Deltaproteobacteria bacterium]